jgi:TolB protein
LDFTLGGTAVGATLTRERAGNAAFTAAMRSIVPVDHAQIVCNGRVVRELALVGKRTAATVSGTLPLNASGWCVLRAFTAHAEYPVLDNFVYATTSPVYISLQGARPRSPSDARFFEAWIDHLLVTTAAYPDWNSPAEKAGVLQQLTDARAVYQRLE